MGYTTHADLCAPYITLEEARKERQEEERNEQRRCSGAPSGETSWTTRRSACTSAHALPREEEMDEAVSAAAKRARHMMMSPLAMWFEPALDRDVK
jgi:hypothetical protein